MRMKLVYLHWKPKYSILYSKQQQSKAASVSNSSSNTVDFKLGKKTKPQLYFFPNESLFSFKSLFIG